MKAGLAYSTGGMVAALGAWSIYEVRTIDGLGLQAIFGAVFVFGIAFGLWSVHKRDEYGHRVAMLLLAFYLLVGVYSANRSVFALLGYVTLLILFSRLHMYHRILDRLPPTDTQSTGPLLWALTKTVAVLGMGYGLSLVAVNTALETHLGTTDILSGFLLALALVFVLVVLATAGNVSRRRRRPTARPRRPTARKIPRS